MNFARNRSRVGGGPGLVGFLREEGAAVERERGLQRLPLIRGGHPVERVLRKPLLEGPGVHPAFLPVDGEPAALLADEVVVSQHAAQAQHRHAERLVACVAFFLWPQCVDHLLLGHPAWAEGDQRLEHGQGLLGNFALELDGSVIGEHLEPAERVHAQRPGPGVGVGFPWLEAEHADQALGRLGFDAVLECDSEHVRARCVHEAHLAPAVPHL
jgi:hypothetical protein